MTLAYGSVRAFGATRVMLNKICTMTAKSAPPSRYARRGTAYPPCTPAAHCVRAGRGVIRQLAELKYQDPTRMLRPDASVRTGRVTATVAFWLLAIPT